MFPLTNYLTSKKCDGCGCEICTSLHDHSQYEYQEAMGMGCKKEHHYIGLCLSCYTSLTKEEQNLRLDQVRIDLL